MSEPEAIRPGSILKAEREALGVTVREVSETLNLSMTMIEAIESDDLDSLPGPVFARGYVRAYARLLELDPEPLMAQFPQVPDAKTPIEAAPESPIWEWIRRRPELVLGGAAGVLVLVVVTVLVILLWPANGPQSAAPAAAEPGEPEPYATTAEPPATAGPEAGESASSAAAPAQPEAPEAEANAAEAAPSSEPPALPAAEPMTAAGAAASSATAAPLAIQPAAADETAGGHARRITESGDDRLSFTFSDDCWVEVRDAGGATLYGDLSRADTHLELVGQGPFRILLGYAPGARLDFNGEAVALAPHTRDNVATLVLGQ